MAVLLDKALVNVSFFSLPRCCDGRSNCREQRQTQGVDNAYGSRPHCNVLDLKGIFAFDFITLDKYGQVRYFSVGGRVSKRCDRTTCLIPRDRRQNLRASLTCVCLAWAPNMESYFSQTQTVAAERTSHVSCRVGYCCQSGSGKPVLKNRLVASVGMIPRIVKCH